MCTQLSAQANEPMLLLQGKQSSSSFFKPNSSVPAANWLCKGSFQHTRNYSYETHETADPQI